jgi:site-specific recombinase XerD
MFDRFLKRPHALARHRDGPLAEERLRYLAHCAEQQMSQVTLQHIASYLLVVARLLRLAERPGERVTQAEVEAAADRLVQRQPRSPSVRKDRRLRARFVGRAIRWLRFLGRLQPPAAVPQPYADHVAQFTDHLLQERGLAPRTVAYSRRTIQEFLAHIHQAGLRLQTLTAAHLDDLRAQKVQDGRCCRVTLKRWATALRPFLRFAEGRRWCRPGLAAALRTPRVYPQEGLPLGPSWEDVQRLIATAEGDDPKAIRDRALLLLLAVYGLRAGEVAALRLEDFDWEREVLTIRRGKQKRVRAYPLCRPVGDAVLRYLREVRPRSDHREVFLRVLAPFRPLADKSLGGMVSWRLHALGLSLPHYGSHALRHACATHLLARGLSLKEIGDHLGHQSPETTRIYAKVDLAELRVVGEFDLEGLL